MKLNEMENERQEKIQCRGMKMNDMENERLEIQKYCRLEIDDIKHDRNEFHLSTEDLTIVRSNRTLYK